MNISYTYKVQAVYPESNCMDILFSSENLPDVLVSVRIPFEGENIDAVISSFAPFTIWQPNVTPLQDIQVGHAGEIKAIKIDPEISKNLEMWEQIEFEKNIGNILVKFGLLKSNPAEIEITKL